MLPALMEPDARVVLCTVPDASNAERIATAVVEARLAACVNQVAGVASTYRWDGKVERAEEVLLVMKTTADRLADLQARVVALHPHAVPEVIALPVIAGHAPYLDWISESTRP